MAKVASIWSRLGEVASLAATPLLPAHYAELLSPLANANKARGAAVRDEAPGVKTFVLRPGRGWGGHRAGQHLRVGIAIDGRVVTRTYSISSAPERRGGCIDITVKAQGKVSNALHAVEVGAFVTIAPATGGFRLLPMLELEAAGEDGAKEDVAARRLLFVTGGSGITPIAAMLRSLAARNAMPDVVHVHYARTAEDVIFGEELRCLAVDHPSYRLIEIHTARDPRRFDEDGLAARVPDWRTREAWACGPQSLLVAIESVYASHPHVGQGDRSMIGQPHVGPGDRSMNGQRHVGPVDRSMIDQPSATLGAPSTSSQPHVRPVLHIKRFHTALAVLPANASGGRVRFVAAVAKKKTTTHKDTTTNDKADSDATT